MRQARFADSCHDRGRIRRHDLDGMGILPLMCFELYCPALFQRAMFDSKPYGSIEV